MHPKTQASPFFRRANTMLRQSTVSWGNPWYAADLVGARQPVRENGGSKIGRACPPSPKGRAVCPLRTACYSTSSSSVVWWTTHARSGGALPTPTSLSCRCCNPSVFALRLTHSGTLVTGQFTTICGFHSLPTTSKHWPRALTRS
jgi:hypothetical protein